MKKLISSLVIVLVTASAALAQTFSVTSLSGLVSGGFARVTAINNNGDVVGYANNSSGNEKPVVWLSGGSCTDLGLLQTGSGNYGQAVGINDSGQIVGYCTYSSEYHAFVSQAGTMTDINPSGWLYSFADSISADGIVSGHGSVTGYGVYSFTYNTNTSTFTTFSHPGGMTNGTLMFGYDYNTGDLDVTTLSTSAMSTISPPSAYSGYYIVVDGVNPQGQFCGEFSNGIEAAFVFTPSGVNGTTGWFRTLGQYAGGNQSVAFSVNAFGAAVGIAYAGTGHSPGSIPFLEMGSGYINLNSCIPSGTTLVQGQGINDHFQIACTTSDSTHPAVLTRTS